MIYEPSYPAHRPESLFPSDRFELLVSQWGPATGSSLVRVYHDALHNRIVLYASTDFGHATCGFSREQLRAFAEDILRVV